MIGNYNYKSEYHKLQVKKNGPDSLIVKDSPVQYWRGYEFQGHREIIEQYILDNPSLNFLD